MVFAATRLPEGQTPGSAKEHQVQGTGEGIAGEQPVLWPSGLYRKQKSRQAEVQFRA